MGARADKFAEVAKVFGVHSASASDEQNARAAIDAVAKLSIEVGTARSIEDLLKQAATQAVTDVCIMSNPVPASYEDVLGMYRKAVNNPALYPALETVGVAKARL